MPSAAPDGAADPWSGPAGSRTGHVALILLGLAGLLTLASVAQLLVPGVPVVILAPELDYVVNTAAMVISGAAALLAWIRHRQTDEADALFQASAFTVLSLGGAISIVILVTNNATAAGFDRATPGQAPLYLWTFQRLFAAVLLLAGAAAVLRRSSAPRFGRSAITVIAPSVALLAITIAMLLVSPELPILVPPEDLAQIVRTTDVIDPSVLSPVLAAVQLVLAGLFTASVVAYYLVYRRESGRRPYVAYLSLALVFAAFSQVHFAIVPGAYSDIVTSGDVLRLSFYTLLGLGIVAAWRQDLHELRRANASLRAMRALDADRAALQERSRMAREIHDGLVQELWLARLTQGRLLQGLEHEKGPTSDMTKTARRVDTILEEALSEARQAVVTLQSSRVDGLAGMLERFVEDYAERFGLDVDCEIPEQAVDVSARTLGEILRICREALTNARKHGGPSHVRVALEERNGMLELTVADDGAGFDPTSTPSGFGLRGMHQRAAALGGTLQIEAATGQGTRVTFTLPRNRL